MKVVGRFDNSAANPLNPNRPPRDVIWGEMITDEMVNGFLYMTKKGQDLTRPGERDDLAEIFARQPEDYRNQRKAERLRTSARPKRRKPNRRARPGNDGKSKIARGRIDRA